MDHIDHIYYINLDYRTDRREEFENEMKSFGLPDSKITRIPAVATPQLGILGCALSHKMVLELFLESSHTNCLILEDDFQWNLDSEYIDFMLNPIFDEKIDFDCIMFSGNIEKSEPTEWPFLRRVFDAQTTAGYLITREFAVKLHKNFSESSQLLKTWFEETGEKKHEYCLDIFWKQLQQRSKWYILHPKAGKQRESYSDIEQKIVNYGV